MEIRYHTGCAGAGHRDAAGGGNQIVAGGMEMKNDKNDKIDGRFENYRGTKRFCVSHPDYSPTLTIAAPCEAAAIVAAAQKWGGRS